MSQLVRKRPGSPLTITPVTKYRLVPATQAALEDQDDPKNNPFKFEFYCDDQSYLIPNQMRIKKSHNAYDDCDYFYLARYGDLRSTVKKERSSTDFLSVMYFNAFEASKMLEILQTFLECFEAHDKIGPESLKLLSYFDKDPERSQAWKGKDWPKFFSDPDGTVSEKIQVRFGFNKEKRRYTGYIYNRIPIEKQRDNWEGSVFAVGIGAIGTLVNNLKTMLAEIEGDGQGQCLSVLPAEVKDETTD